MITIALQRLGTLFKYLGISLVAITLSRLFLYFFNTAYFNELDTFGFLAVLWHGLRFDLSALAMLQAPFLLIFFLPFPKRWAKIKRILLIGLFGLANLIVIALNGIDSIYFRFTLKRSTADLFSYITTGDDALRLLPQFLMDYWFIPLLVLLILWLSIKAFKKVKVAEALHSSLKAHILNVVSLLFLAGLIVLSIRGGFQLKPIRIIQAAEAVGMTYAPLALNTPFSIIKTFNKQNLKPKHYFDENKLVEYYNPIITLPTTASREKNVVLIIMESFSKEYMGPPFGLENKTPFLDSLAKQSLFFNRAFANGKRSIEGIPAIIAGLPALMEDSYITSVYANNQLDALPVILKKQGYQTAFYHGGKTGTMGFDAFVKVTGFDAYFGMEDFDGKNSYDGLWGIYDEPFFQFFARKLNEMEPPFFSAFFSLSSHHPYTIPEQYKDTFKEGKHPLLNTVAYADMALRLFFEQVKEETWYNNTLFVITADHTGQSFNPPFATRLGNYAVPLLFFSPNDSTLKGVREEVAQHIDILPSTLEYLGYSQPFFSFGQAQIDTNQEGFAINYLNNIYQFVEGDFVIHFDGEKTVGYYNYINDSLLHHNLRSDERMIAMERKCKAVIQTFNYALINNQQSVETYSPPLNP